MRRLLALYGLAIVLAACESAPVTGRSQMMLVSESEERQMGLQAYREVLSKEPLSEDAHANELVQKVGLHTSWHETPGAHYYLIWRVFLGDFGSMLFR